MASFRQLVKAVSTSALLLVAVGCPALGPAALKREAVDKTSAAASLAAARSADQTKAVSQAAAQIVPAQAAPAQDAPVPAGMPAPPIEFVADFGDQADPGDRQIQAEPKHIRGNTVASLINPNTAKVIGTSTTDSTGRFSVTFGGGFVPDPAVTYVLEAYKGIGPAVADLNGTPNPDGNYYNYHQPGYQAIRIRTLMKWTGQWSSLTSGLISVNPSTTAFTDVYLHWRGVTGLQFNDALIFPAIEAGKADNCGSSDTLTLTGTQLTGCTGGANGSGGTPGRFHTAQKIVNDLLNADQDPVAGFAVDTTDRTIFSAVFTPPKASFVTTSGYTGSGPTQFDVDGGPFLDGGRSIVWLNGLPLTTSWTNPTKLRVTLSNGCGQTGVTCTAQQQGLVPTTGPVGVSLLTSLLLTGKSIGVIHRFTGMSTGSGKAGTTIAINGNGFDPSQTTVYFTGSGGSANVKADATVAKDGSSIAVTVPESACSGPIVVVGPSGNLTNGSLAFTVDPVIHTTNTQQGAAGTTVTVDGTGFGPSPGLVEFGGSGFNGNIRSWSPTRIVVDVPSNAGTGNVYVQTNQGRRSPAGPRFRVQFTISGWSFSTNWSPTNMVITGAGFGSGPNNDNRVVGVNDGAMVRIKSWTATRIDAVAYGQPGHLASYQLLTSGGPAGGVNPVRQNDYRWNGSMSRRVVDGLGNLWHHDRSNNIWKVPVDTAGQAQQATRNRHMINNGCRVTSMVFDSYDALYVTDHCGRINKYVMDQNMDNPNAVWRHGGFPALQRIALDASNNVYVKQHGCKGCRNWARNYFYNTHQRDYFDIGVTHGRATSGGGTLVNDDNNYYTFNARQGRCQRIQMYWPGQSSNPGGRDRWNRGRDWETHPFCGGPTRNPHRIPSGLAQDTSSRKFGLHVWGGIYRMNSGWGRDANWSGYRCSWHATVGTDLNGNVYFGNMGCHGSAGVVVFRGGGPANWVGNHSGGDFRF